MNENNLKRKRRHKSKASKLDLFNQSLLCQLEAEFVEQTVSQKKRERKRLSKLSKLSSKVADVRATPTEHLYDAITDPLFKSHNCALRCGVTETSKCTVA